MSNHRDEPSFEELMAMEGVVPLEDQGKRRGSAPKSPPPGARARQERPAKPDTRRARSPAPRAPERPSGPGSGRGTPLGAGHDPRSPAAPGSVSTSDDARLQQELAQTRARAERAEAELADLRAALARAQAELAQTQVREEIEAELAQARTDQDKLDAERRQLHEQCRRLREDLAAARQAESRRTPLEDVLEARGLEGMDEAVQALMGLLDARPQELVDAVTLADAEALTRLLDQRVALVHDDGGTDLSGSVIVHVPPERCEITGGSDIRGAFRRLLDACQGTPMREITIVGGSPAYRQQLKALAEPHHAELRLNLVSGTRRRTRRRAAADMRKSSLVVIWGATELDHSVSAVYTGAGAPILRVPHRGISRMLDQVAEAVRGRRD